MIFASTPQAKNAYALLTSLQDRLVAELEAAARSYFQQDDFETMTWERESGRFGGGWRKGTSDTLGFDRASVNFSQVQYESEPNKKLNSATALSTIIHPQNPFAPSMHMHISWTEYKSGEGYWRIMADLNPSTPDEDSKTRFSEALKAVDPELYTQAKEAGDRYFFIPVLGRHRGVSHYYLEGYATEDHAKDQALALAVGETVIKTYANILRDSWAKYPGFTERDKERQLAYHSLYLLQVLTLDRGTTSGLLVHNQNDVGIMGSLPSHVDRTLLEQWVAKMPEPQDKLLLDLVGALRDQHPSPVTENVRKNLAQVVRTHYQHYPEALKLQAMSEKLPPTVANHL